MTTGDRLCKALQAAGLLPKNCVSFSIRCAVGEPMRISAGWYADRATGEYVTAFFKELPESEFPAERLMVEADIQA